MSSIEIKDALADRFKGTKPQDWKRVSKKTIKGTVIRIFKNDTFGIEIAAVNDDEDDDPSIHEIGQMLFYTESFDASDYGEDQDSVMIMFAPETFWQRNHYLPDQHLEWILVNIYGVPEDMLDEVSENQFMPYPDFSLDAIKTTLTGLGMKFVDMSTAGS